MQLIAALSVINCRQKNLYISNIWQLNAGIKDKSMQRMLIVHDRLKIASSHQLLKRGCSLKGWGSWGGGNEPPSHQLRGLESAVSSPSGVQDRTTEKLVLVYLVASEITNFVHNRPFTCHSFAITGHDSFWPGWAQIPVPRAEQVVLCPPSPRLLTLITGSH